MNNNLQAFEVNGNDPYFTADKWNETLNYSKCFEKMINGILGNNFKGIYKPFENYNLYDYVWFNDNYYQIISEKVNTVEVLQKENYDNLYYHNSNYYIGLNPNKKIVSIIGQNEYELSNMEFDKFYLFENEIVAVKENNLYKIDIDKKRTTPLNWVFDKEIKDIQRDKFSIYVLSNNEIECGNTINNDVTETKLLFKKENVSAMAINDTELFVLTKDNHVEILNKSSGNQVSSFDITQHIDHDVVKMIAPDNYSLVVYNGEELLMFFNNNGQYIYSGNAKNDYITYGVSALTCNNGYICASNNAGATTYLSNRYNLEKVDVSSLLLYNANVNRQDCIEEHFDFSKGQFETSTLKPEYENLSVINDKGINISNFVSYTLQNLLNKTIQFNIELQNPINEKICSINIGTKLADINVNLPKGKYVLFIDLDESSYRVTTYLKDSKTITTHSYEVGDNLNKITFKSNTAYILNSFNIFNNIISLHKKDYFKQNSVMSFDIQPSYKSYPYSYIKSDEHGNINLNLENKSILKSNKGYKVNLSDNLNSSEENIGFNLKGANALKTNLMTKISDEVKKLIDSLANKIHRHKWSDLDEVPSATISKQGIVQLSNSISNSSEIIAATEKAVKTAYDKASHGHPYLSNTGGTVNGNVTINGTTKTTGLTINGFTIKVIKS